MPGTDAESWGAPYEAAFVELLREALQEGLAAGSPPGGEDQARFAWEWEKPRRLTPAAVLIPIETGPEGPRVLLTQRTEHLHHHPGQISFPGGRIEPGDRDAVAAALRETEEEIGLAAVHVRVLGRLGSYASRTGFDIVPVLGVVPAGLDLRLDAFEVARVLRVPLAFLLDPANRRLRPVADQAGRRVWSIRHSEGEIWGVTAGILAELHTRLAASRKYSLLHRHLTTGNCQAFQNGSESGPL